MKYQENDVNNHLLVHVTNLDTTRSLHGVWKTIISHQVLSIHGILTRCYRTR